MQLLLTGHLDLVISAYINLKMSPEEPNGQDQFAYAFSIIIVILYTGKLIVIGYIIRESLKLISDAEKLGKNVEEYRASKEDHNKYDPIVGDLDFKKRISLT